MSEVEELRAEVERLRIRNKSLWADLGQANQWSWEQHDRAESAERARDAALAEVTGLRDRLGRVEALADDEFATDDTADLPDEGVVFEQGAMWAFAEAGRLTSAALAVPVTGDTEDASPAAEGATKAHCTRHAAAVDGCLWCDMAAEQLRRATSRTGAASPTEQATEGGAK